MLLFTRAMDCRLHNKMQISENIPAAASNIALNRIEKNESKVREHAESLEKIILFFCKSFLLQLLFLICILASKTFAADAAAVQTQTVQNINPGAAATVSANMSKTLSADQIAAIQALQLQAHFMLRKNSRRHFRRLLTRRQQNSAGSTPGTRRSGCC